VFFTTNIRENGVAIPENVQLVATYRGEEINKFIDMINNLGFKIDNKYRTFIRASLDVDIGHLNSDKKEIKKMVKNKLEFIKEK